MSKKQITVERAREIAKALNDAMKPSKKSKASKYIHVRALRRGNSIPTFASTPMKDVGEDEDSVVI